MDTNDISSGVQSRNGDTTSTRLTSIDDQWVAGPNNVDFECGTMPAKLNAAQLVDDLRPELFGNIFNLYLLAKFN